MSDKHKKYNFRLVVEINVYRSYFEIPVDDGSFALMQSRDSFARVAEDLQHLWLCESSLQALVHQIYNLTTYIYITHTNKSHKLNYTPTLSCKHCVCMTRGSRFYNVTFV